MFDPRIPGDIDVTDAPDLSEWGASVGPLTDFGGVG